MFKTLKNEPYGLIKSRDSSEILMFTLDQNDRTTATYLNDGLPLFIGVRV
jgi:hypothetical protein